MTIKMANAVYSETERKLLEAFKYDNLIDHVCVPHSLYRMCVEKVFVENMTGPAVEALRRVYAAIQSCKPYRLTPEFEELASMEPTSRLDEEDLYSK